MSVSIVIVGSARTPMGGMYGELSGLTASELGAPQSPEKYQLTREAQDEYALTSLARATKAQETGFFEIELLQ